MISPDFSLRHRHPLADAAMSRYAAGDNVSFAELHDLLAPRLERYLARRTSHDVTVQDLLQQTLLRIHAARGRFRAGCPVFPWAFAIARSVLIDSIRHSKRQVKELIFEPIEEPSTEAGPEDRLELLLFVERLKATLPDLPQGQRVAFELLDVEGRSLEEVAELLGTTKVAAKIRAHRARCALKEALRRSPAGAPDA
jgi:RNA polymerase sigma-70 factor (ECF subfamily)